MVKEIKIGKSWLILGASPRIGLGFYVSKYELNIDFLMFWVSVEW